MDVGSNIRRLRKEAHMTQEDLASALGVARSTVTQWERNWSQPRMGKIAKIAEVLGTSIADVIHGPASSDEAPGQSHACGDGPTIPLYTFKQVLLAKDSSDAPVPTKRMAVPAAVLNNHPDAEAALVVDDCMDKVAPKGLAVVFDPELEPSNGKIAIVETEDHGVIMRRWYRGGNTLMLVADSHAAYDDIVIADNRPIRVIGTIVWIQSPEEL